MDAAASSAIEDYSQYITRMIANRLIALYPGDRAQFLAQLHLDCEHAIADVLNRGYPEWIAKRHQGEIEGLQAYLRELANAGSQGTGAGS